MTPLLLLHGFTGSPASWDLVIEHLPGRAALRPALLGHEASSDATSFDDEVDRLAGLAGSEPVHLAGYSLGARLALGILARHPERVARATLVSVHPGLTSDAERAERRLADGRWIEILENQGLDAFVSAWGAQPLFASQRALSPHLRERRQAERRGHAASELARSLRITGLAEMPDYRPALRAVRAPVTLLTGELDAKFSALAGELLRHLPAARHRIVPGAGHDLLLERPDLVAAAIARETDHAGHGELRGPPP